MQTDDAAGVLEGSVPLTDFSDNTTTEKGSGRLGLVIHTDSPDLSKQVFVSEYSSKPPQPSPTDTDLPSTFDSFVSLPDEKSKSQSQLELCQAQIAALQLSLEAAQEENKKLNETSMLSKKESERLREEAADLQLQLKTALAQNQQVNTASQLSNSQSEQGLKQVVSSDSDDEEEDEGDDYSIHQPPSEYKNFVKADAHENQCQHSVSDVNSDEEKFLDYGYVPIVIPFDTGVPTKQNFKSLFKMHVKGEQQQPGNSKTPNQVLYEFANETQDKAQAALGAFLKVKKVSSLNKYVIIVRYRRKEKNESVSSDSIYFTCGEVDYEVEDNWVQVEFDSGGNFKPVDDQFTNFPYVVSLTPNLGGSVANHERASVPPIQISKIVRSDQLEQINKVKAELKKEIANCEASYLYGRKSPLYNFFRCASSSLEKKIARKKIKLDFVGNVINEMNVSNDDIGHIVNKLAAQYKTDSKWDDVRAGISSDALGYSRSKTFNLLKSLGYNEDSVNQLVGNQLRTG